MDYRQRTTRLLHDEHEATFDACARLENALVRWRENPPPVDDPDWRSAVEPFAQQLAGDVFRHFAFEEDALFPVLEAVGDGEIAALLLEEHATVRECAQAFVTRLGHVRAGAGPGDWTAFRTAALELTERLVVHAQKEEMVLLPALDDALDDARDAELHAAYVAG